jgi:dihydrofolate reductase
MSAMGKIVVHEFITVDGVFETPSWSAGYPFDPRMGEAIGSIMGSCEGLLLGRRTYEMFAASWPQRTAAEDPGAPFMNDSPKYVVSGTVQNADWVNSTILGSYDAQRLRELKDGVSGGLYVSGSGTLVRAMLGDGLIDELHLFVYPLCVGPGERLFREEGPGVKYTLAGSQAFSSGVLHLAYAPIVEN